MSVYSGFATRMLESQYNSLTCKLISLFDQRILSSLRTEAAHSDLLDNEQWALSFCSVFKAMRKLESQKYLPPKYSHYCKALAEHLGAYSQGLSRDASMNSSRVSTNISREWDSNMHQLEAMLIEESRITEKPPRLGEAPKRSGSFVKRALRFERVSDQVRARASYSSRGTRKPQVTPLSPGTQDTGESIGYPRSVDVSRLEDVSNIPPIFGRRKRRSRKEKLSEVYQDRAFTKLLAELRS